MLKTFTHSIIALSIASICVSCKETKTTSAPEKQTETAEKKPETLVETYDLSDMDQAIAKARSSTKEFITALKKGNAESYAVKAPITDENGTEHFWLTEVSYKDGVFKGNIGNDPGIVKNVTFGQNWELKENEISDWMYIVDERIHGGYTIDPLLDSYPKEQADALRAKLVR